MPVNSGTLTLEFDNTSNRLATEAWTDETSSFLGFSDERRRTGFHFWSPYQAASADITVLDSGDDFSPENAERAKIRLSVTYSGATHRLFVGSVWNVDNVGTRGVDKKVRRLTCYDAFADFNEATVDTSTAIVGGRMDQFVGNVLNAYTWHTARRDFDNAQATAPDLQDIGTLPVMRLLRLAAEAEGGDIFMRRDGYVRFGNRGRLNALASETPVATFGEGGLPIGRVQLNRGSRNLLNQQTVDSPDSLFVAQTVPDPSAGLSPGQLRRGVKPGPNISNLLIDSAAEASSLAAFRVSLGQNPPIRVSFNHNPAGQDDAGNVGFASVYGLDIGSVIQIELPRQGFSGPAYIESMGTSYDRATNVWGWRIGAVQTPIDNTFTLADANDPADTRGTLGTNTELGF